MSAPPVPFETADAAHAGLSIEQPEPPASGAPRFDLVEAEGVRVATNGRVRMMVLDGGGRLFRRRGIAGLSTKAAGEAVIPQLNALAGELLAQPDMPADAIAARLQAMAASAVPVEPRRVEWAVAELDGVRVYTDGESIVMTRRDLTL